MKTFQVKFLISLTWELEKRPNPRSRASQRIKVQFDNGLERLCRIRIFQTVRQRLKPRRVFGLQGEQLGDRVAPALWPGGAPVGGTR